MNVHTWERAVVTALRGIDGAAVKYRRKPWTRAVLRALVSAGREQGFWTAATGGEAVEADSGEWLWDCSWREYQDEESLVLRSVPMVAECEWNTDWDNLRKDFEKLLAANAPLRVFVFSGERPNKEEIPERSREVVGRLCDRIGAMKFTAPYEVRYVLAAWEDFERPAFRIFTVSGQGEVLREIAP